MSSINADQAAGLRRIAKPRSVRVIAVASGKGGVGKTNVTVNLALSMSHTGKDVMIMDADLGLANIDILLGIHPKYNLSHLVNGERTLEEVIVTGPGGIRIVPAASGIQGMSELSRVQHTGLIHAFSELSIGLDVLLVDCAAGISDSVISFCKASQEVIVVICDEPTSLTDAYALIKVLNRDHDIQRVRVISNMVGNVNEGRELYQKLARVTNHYLDVTMDFMGTIPYDDFLRKSVQKQRAVVDAYPRSKSAMAFGNLAKKIDDWPISMNPSGHVEFFLERLIESKQWGKKVNT